MSSLLSITLPDGEDQEPLIVRCNIFEALLIRHFLSEEDFNKLVMKHESEQ